MSVEIKQWLASELPKHERLCSGVLNIIKTSLANEGIDVLNISGRTKDASSAIEKAQRKSYVNFQEKFTDLTGIRIVTYFNGDIEKITQLIRRLFEVDDNNSLDQTSILGDDRIGYRSVHFVCSLGQSRRELMEYRDLTDLKFEVQLRTVLQHAWAELAHDRSYKFAGGLPKRIQRKLNLYSGMLELVDAGFDEISKEIDEYKEELLQSTDEKFRQEDINSLSLKKFMDKYINENGLHEFVNNTPISNIDDVIKEMNQFGWTKISSLYDNLDSSFAKKYISASRSHYPINFRHTTMIGLLRDSMMYIDPAKYFSVVDIRWGAIGQESYNMISEMLGDRKTIFQTALRSDKFMVSEEFDEIPSLRRRRRTQIKKEPPASS